VNVLERELARSLNPVKVAEAIGLDPDLWQVKVLRSGHRRILLNCSRQSGKSTVAAVLAVHAALYDPGSLVLLVSFTVAQCDELLQTCLQLYRALGRPVPARAENQRSLILENGSRILVVVGKEQNLRGYSAARLIVVDESASIPDAVADALWPMVAVSRGRIIALGTPRTKVGWFYERWTNGGPGWLRFAVPATECPRISAEHLAEEKATKSARVFAAEYLCTFAEREDAAFRRADIDKMIDPELMPFLAGGWKR